MVFCHIVDDFYSQPVILSNLKQKSWWEENAPDKKYNKDYLMALFLHSFSWSFMIHVPIFVYLCVKNLIMNVNVFCAVLIFLVNILIHFYVDDLKANKLKINLVVDQLIHLSQVFMTWFLYVVAMGNIIVW